MSKYHEKTSEKLCGWLANFADKEGQKLVQQNNIPLDDLKNANRIENILDIVNRNKKVSVDEKINEYRKLVGLDLIDNMEKEGKQDEKKEVIASRLPLSIRDKTAQNTNIEKDKLNKIKQFISQIIHNRNGAIATPAILDQLESYVKVDKTWLREHYDEIENMIEQSRQNFVPKQYNNSSINDLTRTDDPIKGDKEQPPFLPPASAPVK